jgi:hypothetical protein
MEAQIKSRRLSFGYFTALSERLTSKLILNNCYEQYIITQSGAIIQPRARENESKDLWKS